MNVHRPGDPTPEAVRRLITRHCAGCGADVRLSPTDEQARSAAIRRSVLHTRPLSSRELADRLRSVLRDIDEDEVELSLLDAPGVMRLSDGRWQR